MSTPRTLDLPDGVEATTIETSRGAFAAHATRPSDATAHVLLVPGWTGSKEDFTAFLPQLAGAGFAATAYDQRGQHETPGADDADYSLSGFAADAVAVARALSPDPVHLLGHSFGGLVAQQAVVDTTDAWRSVSLLCTGPGALGSTPRRPLDQLVLGFRGGLPAVDLLKGLRGRSFGTEPPEIEAFLLDRFERNSRTSITAMTQLLIDAPDVVDRVAATGLPAWVGRGADDDAWPHERQADMARRLGVEVHVVAHAEHSPAVENPDGLAAALLPFLEQA